MRPGPGQGEGGGPRRGRPSLGERFRSLMDPGRNARAVMPGADEEVLTGPVRISWDHGPFRLRTGGRTMEIHPDLPLAGNVRPAGREWMVFDGDRFFDGLAGFRRVTMKSPLLLGRGDPALTAIFGFGEAIAQRLAEVSNRNGDLTILPAAPETPVSVQGFLPGEDRNRLTSCRLRNLERLRGILGHPVALLPPAEALDLVRQANGIFAGEAFRQRDTEGRPGGVVALPDGLAPLVVGDLHGAVDSLLKILVEGGLLAAIERQEACLVLLGDLVHPQYGPDLDDMLPSTIILDLVLTLKVRFPEGIFYLRGNHDSFSPDLAKGAVPQGILFRRFLKEARGKEYVDEVERLFEALPYVVHGSNFVACHGAPVRSKVSRETLVNIRRYPGLQHEIVWNRPRRRNYPVGYGKGSVKRFRRCFDLPKHAPLIVGHTPLARNETVWMDVNEIPGHHVVYSAHPDRAAAMLISGDTALPLEYVPEPLVDLINRDPAGGG